MGPWWHRDGHETAVGAPSPGTCVAVSDAGPSVAKRIGGTTSAIEQQRRPRWCDSVFREDLHCALRRSAALELPLH